MAVDSSRNFGANGLLLFFLLWIYFTIWVLIVPLFDEDVFIVHLFPPREYAILFMSICGWILIIVLSAFIGLVIINHSLRNSFIHATKQE